jgi:thiol-disulfide isomerase/thioredoxin
MNRLSLPAALGVALMIAGCSKAPETALPAPAAPAPKEIAWIRPAAMADVDAAFERARAGNQPVFLFWSAAWCPPCNQVKSTIFTRPDFIEKSRSFIPVYVDGDTPSGQALGKRFSVGGYPTMVLLRPDGSEITRLAGSVEPAKYMQVLDHGIAGGSSARQALAAAIAGTPISTEDWRLLAFYSWETDEQQLMPKADAPATLVKLARACPPQQREAASRLVLQAIAASATAKGDIKPAADKADALASLQSILARPELVREHYDLVAGYAAPIVEFTTQPKSKQREQLIAQWNTALDALVADATLSNAGRIWALSGKVDLARIDNKQGALAEPLLLLVREQVARADRATTDINERQSVITSAGAVLADAGLLDESDALLTAELKRSHSPYYYMLGLASNARKRGTPEAKIAAINWAQQAYETATGPATRLQWGGAYVNYLLELAPADSARIEAAAASVIGEAAKSPDAFSARSRSSLVRMSGRLQKWNKDGKHDAVIARLHEQLAPACAADGLSADDRAACSALFTPAQRA